MSRFIFGAILLNEKALKRTEEDIAWEIIRLGMEKHIYVLMENNILEDDVLTMINEHEKSQQKKIKFLLSSSPFENTSDSLISPSSWFEGRMEEMLSQFLIISTWISSLFNIKEIEHINVYFTEVYDISFATFDIKAKDFTEILQSEIKEHSEIPSMVFKIAP
jgi:hypothetical protein